MWIHKEMQEELETVNVNAFEEFYCEGEPKNRVSVGIGQNSIKRRFCF